jgi:hypothetical protein
MYALYLSVENGGMELAISLCFCQTGVGNLYHSVCTEKSEVALTSFVGLQNGGGCSHAYNLCFIGLIW